MLAVLNPTSQPNSRIHGLDEFLGVNFILSSKERVIAEMELGPGHFARDDVVRGGVLMALADCCGTLGAALNLAPGHHTETIESKTNFLRQGFGGLLRAEAEPIHFGRTTSIWRTTIHRGDERPVAEVTQTQTVLAEPQTQTDAAPDTEVEDAMTEARAAAAPRGRSVVEDRKRQIFEGACKVISEKGFANASIREIAAAAGMPVPTMYLYIDRKEDLLYFIYEFFMQGYIDSLNEISLKGRTAAEKLELALHETIANFDRNHEYIQLMFQETRSLSLESRKKVYALDGSYIGFWRDLLDQLASSGELRCSNAELTANIIYFLCAVWPLRHWTIGKFGRQEVTDTVSEFILKGLGLAPAPATEVEHVE